MIYTKSGVSVNGIKPEILFAVYVASLILKEMGVDTVITSALDGQHSRTSLHYVGYAVDIRMRYFTSIENARAATNNITRALTNEYDVILEWGDGSAPHLHVEFQPKRDNKEA